MVSLSNHERLSLRQAQGERGWDGPRALELTQLSSSEQGKHKEAAEQAASLFLRGNEGATPLSTESAPRVCARQDANAIRSC